MTSKIVLMRGLPGSGKSTRALSEYSDHMRINRDTIRTMLFGEDYKFSKAREKRVKEVRNALIADCVRRGVNCVVDDTNLGTTSYDEIVAALYEMRYSIVSDETCLEVPLDECIKRDARREKSVGKEVIECMWRNHLQPEQPVYDSALADCIIVDVDGTLARMCTRHPFDWAKVSEDAPVQHVIDIVNMMSAGGCHVIAMSGRDSCCRADTMAWLTDYGVQFNELYMRPEHNQEKDTVIKQWLYEKHVKGKYNVKVVFDDRDSVVCLWRTLGLPTFQVAYGAF